MKINSLQTELIKNKTILVRVDYNMPLKPVADNDSNTSMTVADDQRIQNSLDTVKLLLQNNCKVILMSHLGRPKGEKKPALSLKPVADHLKEKFNLPVHFIDDCVGPKVEAKLAQIKNGEILLLENLRFYEEEGKNSEEFGQKLASLAQAYVNEAFSCCHRKHASMVQVPQLLPHYAGLGLVKELKYLDKLTNNPKKPFVIVIGGAKISDKVEAINNLEKIADAMLVGGGVSNNFLKAQGIEIYKSYLQDQSSDLSKQGINYVDVAKKIIEENKIKKMLKDGYIPLPKIIYPFDVLAAPNMDSDQVEVICLHQDMKDTDDDKDLMYLDIGPKTTKLFQELILQAGTIFWNGPMGVFEKEVFANGTQEVARAIAKSSATTILGGGDTIAAINKFDLKGRFDYVSTAGGASLDYLAGKKLPGLKNLQ